MQEEKKKQIMSQKQKWGTPNTYTAVEGKKKNTHNLIAVEERKQKQQQQQHAHKCKK